MNSLACLQNRQEPAQKKASFARPPCNGGMACQSPSQAGALSPRLAVVRRNHNPSPSSPRSWAFWPGPGFFCRDFPCATPRASLRLGLARRRDQGRIKATHTTDQGSETCTSQNLSQGSWWPLFWPDASGMTSNAPGLAPRLGPSSLASATATSLPVRSSVPAPARSVTTSEPAEDKARVNSPEFSMPRPRRAHRLNTPARGFASGGFFVANARGTAPHLHEEGTGYVQ